MTTDHQRLTCEFQLLRYVPNPVRDEFVHVGVLLREQGAAQNRCASDGAALHARLAAGALS